MARIRSVHPSLFTDEAWVSCSPLARVLYIGLLTDADDQGLFEWKPLQIRMRLLPGDNADIAALLQELEEANLIAPLKSAGKSLGAVRKFCRFQRPKKPSAHFVLPPEWRTYVGIDAGDSDPERPDDRDGSELEADDAATVPNSTPVEGGEVPNQFRTSSELGEQMEDGGDKKEEIPPKPPRGISAKSAPDGFEEFWSAYPRKTSKGTARKAYASALRKAPADRILAGVRRYRFSDEQKFIPHPTTWLNGERWADGEASLPPDPPPEADPEFSQWRLPCLMLTKNNYWNTLDWGPRPGTPGCRCPARILRMFDINPEPPQPVAGAA